MRLFALILITISFNLSAKSSPMEMGGDFLDMNKADTVQLLGDACAVALPVMSFALNLQKEPSHKGLMQNLTSQASVLVVTVILKQLTNKVNLLGYEMGKRPDGKNYNFPSGHTAIAFASTFHVEKRYDQYFWPFMSLSLFTAFSRIYSKKHDVPAVLTGALLGYAMSSYFTTSFHKNSNAYAYYSPKNKSWQFGFAYSF